ncbi:MAG: hypothetical protein HGA42_05655 [Nostocales cyanobacterium W4_Combined_metabat2_030]|nr:hypothetical protein [Nostocales cyanobacterium W4_Combined_metabat2_030]
MDSSSNDHHLIELIKSFRKEIIDRKWAEKKANDALDYAESILDSVISPIIVLDNEYKIISVNMPFFHLFNISIEKIIGKYFFEISDSLFNIDILKEMIISNEKDINEFELFHEFKIVGKKYLQIKCVNLQYNIKHLNFKLVIINDITDSKNAMDEIRVKHALLSKIHHRTKNNLIMIESLLKLQLKSVKDEKVEKFLIDNISRISAVTSVHLILGKSNNFESIDFNQFVQKLICNIKVLYGKEVKYTIDGVDIKCFFKYFSTSIAYTGE